MLIAHTGRARACQFRMILSYKQTHVCAPVMNPTVTLRAHILMNETHCWQKRNVIYAQEQ